MQYESTILRRNSAKDLYASWAEYSTIYSSPTRLPRKNALVLSPLLVQLDFSDFRYPSASNYSGSVK
jgi:hypothetical protein